MKNEIKSVLELKNAAICRRFKDGRGSGTGENYKPFLTVRDVPSKGRAHRSPGVTTGRSHHLLSDLELNIFFQLDYNSNVIDIREQFPALRDDTRVISNELGIAHPSIHGVDQVVTTDFLIDVKTENRVVKQAIYAKYASQLEDPRTIEKLQLEISYWASKDIELFVVTEKEVPKQLVQNISWFHPLLFEYDLNQEEREEYFELFSYEFEQQPDKKATFLTSKLDRDYGLESGSHLFILRHLIAQRAFDFDMSNLSVKSLTGKDFVASSFWQNKRYKYAVGE